MDDFFDDLAGRLLVRLRAGRRVIAVDGVDGSGKTMFATTLAEHMARHRPTLLVHLDDFLNPAETRHARGRTSPDGFWLDSYDYELFRQRVLRPLHHDGDGVVRKTTFDVSTDSRSDGEDVLTDPDVVVVVEGMFLHRDELRDAWDASLFLDVPFTVTAARMAERDGSHIDPSHPSMLRYVDGQRLYFAAARPWAHATYVVDNSDVRAPRLIAPESAFAATSSSRRDG